MSLVIKQVFPLGRFHATRWNQNPFEDLHGEWPPSPYRLLRALLARWFQYARETDDHDDALRNRLLQKLADQPPEFYLPPLTSTGVPLKQYQPTDFDWTSAGANESAYMKHSRNLALDRYRALPVDEPIIWHWNKLALGVEELVLLDRLLARVMYFGRNDSYCRFNRLEQFPPGLKANTVLQLTDDGSMAPVLIPTPGQPLDFKVLLANTDDKLLSKRPIPPNTMWCYARLPESERARSQEYGTRHQLELFLPKNIQCVQFAVGGHVFPPLAKWLKIAEQFRGSVLKQLSLELSNEEHTFYMKLPPEKRSEVALISGKDATGTPLKGHGHAYFLIFPDQSRKPTRLVVWRKTPFTQLELKALFNATYRSIIWDHGTPEWALRVAPLTTETTIPMNFLGSAREWCSVTPFVPPQNRRRFRKNSKLRRGETPDRLLAKLLTANGRPEPIQIELLDKENSVEWVNLHETKERRQYREKTKTPWSRPGYRFRIRFDSPVAGPLIVGDSAHFGCGLFAPSENPT